MRTVCRTMSIKIRMHGLELALLPRRLVIYFILLRSVFHHISTLSCEMSELSIRFKCRCT